MSCTSNTVSTCLFPAANDYAESTTHCRTTTTTTMATSNRCDRIAPVGFGDGRRAKTTGSKTQYPIGSKTQYPTGSPEPVAVLRTGHTIRWRGHGEAGSYAVHANLNPTTELLMCARVQLPDSNALELGASCCPFHSLRAHALFSLCLPGSTQRFADDPNGKHNFVGKVQTIALPNLTTSQTRTTPQQPQAALQRIQQVQGVAGNFVGLRFDAGNLGNCRSNAVSRLNDLHALLTARYSTLTQPRTKTDMCIHPSLGCSADSITTWTTHRPAHTWVSMKSQCVQNMRVCACFQGGAEAECGVVTALAYSPRLEKTLGKLHECLLTHVVHVSMCGGMTSSDSHSLNKKTGIVALVFNRSEHGLGCVVSVRIRLMVTASAGLGFGSGNAPPDTQVSVCVGGVGGL